jgi:hypothetical protein
MLPNISRKNGASFRGAFAYHGHDKGSAANPRPETSERVAWTATRNLVNDDPKKAIDEMWHTAEAAAQLKEMSGHDQRGRKCDNPVKTISLSWAPHESPTREQMEGAADSFLNAMGWADGFQSVYIAHNDTGHSHLHIILNRVNANTGMVLSDWQERKRAQRWALEYEREQGLVLCHARLEKYERARFDLQPDGMPHPFAKLMQEQERAFDRSRAEAAVQDMSEKDLLSECHRQEREEFLASGKAQFRQARQETYREVREEFKPLWREHFQYAGELREQLDDATRFAHRQAVLLAREGDHEAAKEVLAALDEQRDATNARLTADRHALRQNQLDTTREHQDEACRGLIEQRAQDFQDIKDRQKEERAEFKELLALREADQPYDINRLQELLGQDAPPGAANDNRTTADIIELAREGGQDHGSPEPALNPFTQQAEQIFANAGYTEPAEKSPRRDVSDVAIGAISAAIEFGVRFMEGFFAPPSPRDQAIAKAWTIREQHEAPKRLAALQDQKQRDDFTRHALTAVREAQAEHDHKRELEHEERGRSRERER